MAEATCRWCKEPIYLWEEHDMWLHSPTGYRYCETTAFKKNKKYQMAQPEDQEDLPLGYIDDEVHL